MTPLEELKMKVEQLSPRLDFAQAHPSEQSFYDVRSLIREVNSIVTDLAKGGNRREDERSPLT